MCSPEAVWLISKIKICDYKISHNAVYSKVNSIIYIYIYLKIEYLLIYTKYKT